MHPLTGSDVADAIHILKKNTALGIDQLDIGWLKRLPIEAKDDIATLLNDVEATGAWPIQALLNIIVLLGRPAGGVRPIALMPIIYRIWCRARRHTLIDWENAAHGHWDAAIRGSSALRAALLGSLFDETAAALGLPVGTILWLSLIHI